MVSAVPAPHRPRRRTYPLYPKVLTSIESDRSQSARFGTDFGQSPPFYSGLAGFDGCDGGARGSLRAYRRSTAGLVLLSLLVGLW